MKHLRVHGGLCNRLRAIASGLIWAEQSGDPLEVLWCLNDEMDFYYSDVFELSHRFRIVEKRSETLFKHFLYSRFNPLKGKYKASYSNFMDAKDFSWLIPREEIKRKIDEYTTRFPKHVIGVHIRRTDNKESVKMSPLSAFMSAMDRELDIDANVAFYVASDDSNAKSTLIKRYGDDRIITLVDAKARFTKGSAYDAVLDLFLLSRTSTIFGSYCSSYSEVASMIGNISLNVILAE